MASAVGRSAGRDKRRADGRGRRGLTGQAGQGDKRQSDRVEGTCGGLLSKLRKEWWEADGDEDASGQRKATLRALYTKKRFQEWAKFRS